MSVLLSFVSSLPSFVSSRILSSFSLQLAMLVKDYFQSHRKEAVVVAVATTASTALVLPLVWRTKSGKKYIRKIIIVPVRKTLSMVATVVGFMSNFGADLFSSSKTKQQWKDVLQKVEQYIEKSGLADEIDGGVNAEFLGNLAILSQMQYHQKRSFGRQLSGIGVNNTNGTNNKSIEAATTGDFPIPTPPSLKMAQHYMRYATAVYGEEMIASVQVALDGTVKHGPQDPLTTMVGLHVGVPPKDVVLTDMTRGGSMDCLNHMVVVDQANKAVVLAVRGTFSLSGVIVDLAGFARDFCGGQAHSGMADMAQAVWSRAINTVQQQLQQHPGYKVVLTGHSLGAGVACLMTIDAYSRNLFPGTVVECMAYAPPPTFCPTPAGQPTTGITSAAVQKAIDNTTAYVHHLDVVPSLSVMAIRRLLAAVVGLNTYLKKLPIQQRVFRRLKLITGIGGTHPPQAVTNAVVQAKDKALPVMAGAPPLAIPAQTVVWLESDEKDDPSYSTHLLDANAYANRLIDIDSSMMTDHMPPNYEMALRVVANHGSSGNGTVGSVGVSGMNGPNGSGGTNQVQGGTDKKIL